MNASTMFARCVIAKMKKIYRIRLQKGTKMSKLNIQSPDPAERDWEYDGDGTRIYKPDAGYGTKTPYKDEYEIWKEKFGGDWHDPPKYKGVKEPYYVDLP